MKTTPTIAKIQDSSSIHGRVKFFKKIKPDCSPPINKQTNNPPTPENKQTNKSTHK